MYFEIISERDEWDEFLRGFSHEKQDVYFSYTYAKANELNDKGKALCSAYVGNNGMRIIYPFIIKEIPGCYTEDKYYDITSFYGYGGPLVESYHDADLADFELLFCEWCKVNNIVAEFIRFHPIFNNQGIFKNNIQIDMNRNTIQVDLGKSIDEIWRNSLTGKNRNQIRKAQKEGVIIKEGITLNPFLNIYTQTMDRLSADRFYYFGEQYFEELSKLIPENMVVFEAIYEEKIIAAALFMCMGENIHYHLSGSLIEYLWLCPNNLLIYHAIEFAKQRGLRNMHLGGGTTNMENDPLLKFKMSFSKNIAEFYIGKRVHNREIYDLFIHKWEIKNHKKAELFLQYEKI